VAQAAIGEDSLRWTDKIQFASSPEAGGRGGSGEEEEDTHFLRFVRARVGLLSLNLGMEWRALLEQERSTVQ